MDHTNTQQRWRTWPKSTLNFLFIISPLTGTRGVQEICNFCQRHAVLSEMLLPTVPSGSDGKRVSYPINKPPTSSLTSRKASKEQIRLRANNLVINKRGCLSMLPLTRYWETVLQKIEICPPANTNCTTRDRLSRKDKLCNSLAGSNTT